MERLAIQWFTMLFILTAFSLDDHHYPASRISGGEPFTVRLTKYHIKPSFEKKFREALSRYVLSALGTAGNIMAEAYYEEEDPSILWIIERWSSRAHLTANSTSGVVKSITLLTKDGLVSPVDTIFMEDLEPIGKEAYRKAPKVSDHPLTIMLFVEARQGTEGTFKSLYHDAMPAFRSEPGVVTYQLCQVSADKTKFITYEKFRSRQAFQDHLKVPAVEPLLKYLRTSIREQPFEKGLHRLIELAPLYRE